MPQQSMTYHCICQTYVGYTTSAQKIRQICKRVTTITCHKFYNHLTLLTYRQYYIQSLVELQQYSYYILHTLQLNPLDTSLS